MNFRFPIDTLLYTTSVINTPSRVESYINMAREKVMRYNLVRLNLLNITTFRASEAGSLCLC
jgi:hypothetical protein